MLHLLALVIAIAPPSSPTAPLPLYVRVVDAESNPVPDAEVGVVDACADDVPDEWGDPPLRSWLLERVAMTATTDPRGEVVFERAPRVVWIMTRLEQREEIRLVGRDEPRNLSIELREDPPLEIVVTDAAGRPVANADVELMTSGYSATCGYMGTRWRGHTGSDGSLRLPNPRYFFGAYVFEKPGEGCALVLRAESPDEASGYRPLEVADLDSDRVVVVKLDSDDELDSAEWARVRVDLRPGSSRDVTDPYLQMDVGGDPNGPLGRDRWFSYVRDGGVNLTFRRDLPSVASVLIECHDDEGQAWRAVLHPASYVDDPVVTAALAPAPMSVHGVVIDSNEVPVADAWVTLFASLPMRDLAIDRAAAIRAPKDPLDRSRLLWPHRRVQVDRDGRFAFPEPWDAFGGDDPRWYLAAEQRGWWRGDPVRIAGSGATERLVLPPR